MSDIATLISIKRRTGDADTQAILDHIEMLEGALMRVAGEEAALECEGVLRLRPYVKGLERGPGGL